MKAYNEGEVLKKFHFVVKGSFALTKNYLPHGEIISSFQLLYTPLKNMDTILMKNE
jgi:hypothetical protein